MSEIRHFKISSALKDIIGRDLITDDNVAVFELVKNAYDAHALSVYVIFENLDSTPVIKIIDNGKGMNGSDIINKWLFVAYSAKKEGNEDSDYRSKIFKNKAFAGSKGIGRFSCDRLGEELKLESINYKDLNVKHQLEVNWKKFEKNLQDNFNEIEVTYDSTPIKSAESGTSLIITSLRSNWDKTRILKLGDALSKLIQPSIDNIKKENTQFRIF